MKKPFLPLFFVLLASCSPVSRNQSVTYYQSHPLALFKYAFAQSQRLSSFEGFGYLTIESPQGGFNGSARVYYQQSDSLLVQIKTGPGVSVGFMLILGQRFWLYNIPDNILWESRGREVPLQELVGVDLQVPNIMDAAIGLPGIDQGQILRLPAADSIHTEFVDSQIHYRFRLGGETHIYIADPVTEAFIAYNLVREPGADTLFYAFKQFQKYAGIHIPRHIQITRPASRERISFFYNRIKVNSGHRRNRFELKVSDRAEVIDLSQ